MKPNTPQTFLLWYAEEAKRVYGETIPSARGDQRFIIFQGARRRCGRCDALELPDLHADPEACAPALAAGCTVVLKPAEATPLCAIAVFKILQEAGVPDGVINLVTAEDPEAHR